MGDHTLEVMLKLIDKGGIIQDHWEVLEVLVKWLGYSFAEVYATYCLLINLL